MFSRRRRQNCRISTNDYSCSDSNEDNHSIRYSYRLIDSFMQWDKKGLALFQEQNQLYPCFMTNRAGKIMYVNKMWQDLCLYSAEEVVSRKFDFLQGLDTDMSKCKRFQRDLERNGMSDMEIINYDKYGKKISLYVKANKINYCSGFSVSEECQPFYWAIVKKM